MRVLTGGASGSQPASGPKSANERTMTMAPYPSTRPVRAVARQHRQGVWRAPVAPENATAQPPMPPVMRKTSSSRSSRSSRSSQRSVYLDLGMPTREEFARLEDQYIASLDKTKKAKALISQEMFDKIWLVLNNPDNSSIDSPQFRWWVRKMFALVHPDELEDTKLRALEASPSEERVHAIVREYGPMEVVLPVVVHDGKRLAIREHIYDIICVCHARVGHGGRDRTVSEIRKVYTWVPKDLVLLFIKHCPTCISKKHGKVDRLKKEASPLPNALPVVRETGSPLLGNSAAANVIAHQVDLPMNNLIVDSRSGSVYSSTSQLVHPSDSYHSQPTSPAYAVPGSSSHLEIHAHGTCTSATSALQHNVVPEGPAWRFPPLHEGYHFSTRGDSMVPQYRYVALPSIHVHDHGSENGRYPTHGKVTLPSLSEVLSGGLIMPNGRPRSRPGHRQPLQAIPSNVAAGTLSRQGSPCPQALYPPMGAFAMGPSESDLTRIDPMLLQDGVHMLALAAEVSGNREAARYAGSGAGIPM